MVTNEKSAKVLRAALRLIAGKSCHSYTTGLGSCPEAGRRRNARYGADRWCDACIAHDALQRTKR